MAASGSSIFHDYLPPALASLVTGMGQTLDQIKLVSPSGSALPAGEEVAISSVEDVGATGSATQQQQAIDVFDARAAVAGAIAATGQAVQQLTGLYKKCFTRNYPQLDELNVAEQAAIAQSVSAATIAAALNPNPLPLTQMVDRQVPVYDQGGNLEGYDYQPYPERWTLAAYPASGPHPDQTLLSRWFEFLRASPERTLRFGLLRGEIHCGQKQWQAAIDEYGRLLGVLPAGMVDRQVVGLRCAAAQLALADSMCERVFVIGDLAAVSENGKPVPGLAPAAMQAGRQPAATSCAACAASRPAVPLHRQGLARDHRRAAAVGEIGRFKISGCIAWFTWAFIHLFYLSGFTNRLFVFWSWGWSYVTYSRGARLITGLEPRLLPEKPSGLPSDT